MRLQKQTARTSSSGPATAATARWGAGHHTPPWLACSSHQQTRPETRTDTRHHTDSTGTTTAGSRARRLGTTRAYRLFAQRRPVHALPALVQFGHDDVLRLARGGLGREVDQQGLVRVGQLLEEEILETTGTSELRVEYASEELNTSLTSQVRV